MAATDTVDALLLVSVGVHDLLAEVGDAGAAFTVVVADLHALDFLGGLHDLNGGHIPANPAVVAIVAKVKLAPGAGVSAPVVDGEGVALGGAPGALGVAVEGDVLGLAGLDADGQSRVAEPAGQLSVGTHLVPESDGPGVLLAAVEADNVLVLAGARCIDFLDVAAPGLADVARVEDVAQVVVLGGFTEAIAGVVARVLAAQPVLAAALGQLLGGGLVLILVLILVLVIIRRLGGGSIGGLGRSVGDGIGGTAGGGGLGIIGGAGGMAGPLVDPGDDLAAHGGIDHVTNTTTLGVSVTALMTVQTGGGGRGRQRRHQEHRILDLHDGRMQGWG